MEEFRTRDIDELFMIETALALYMQKCENEANSYIGDGEYNRKMRESLLNTADKVLEEKNKIHTYIYSINNERKGIATDRYNKAWTEQEDNIIKTYYKTEGKNIVNRLNNRTYRAIRMRASTLHINRGWSEEEKDILRKYYHEYGAEYCHELLSYRTMSSIMAQAGKLGIWSRKAHSKMNKGE